MTREGEESTDSFDVFISHAADDRALAERIEKAMEHAGYHCFLAVDDLNAMVGTRQWSEAIESTLATTPVMIVLVTARGLASKWVTFEWRAFHEGILGGRRSGLIVPVVWERSALQTLPVALRHWQLIDIPQVGEARGLQDLIRLVDGFRRAAQTSEVALDRLLRWTSQRSPSTTIPIVTPARRRFRLTSSLTGWLVVAAAAILVAGLVLSWGVDAIRKQRNSTRGAEFLAANLASKRPAVDSRTTPRAGWEPIEAYVQPNPTNRNLLNRVESWDEARRAFEQVCKLGCDPRQRAGFHFATAEWARLSGKLDEAEKAFEQAHQADLSWGLPLVGLATANVRRDPTLAIQQAKQAQELDSKLWLALSAKAAAFVEQKKYVEAIQELIEARRRAPAESVPLIDGVLALTYHAEGLRDAKAAELAKSACTPDQRISAACAVLAEQALEARAPDVAIRHVELADRDDFVPLLVALGDARQMRGETALAWAAWRRAVGLKERADLQGVAPKRWKAIETAVATNRLPPPRVVAVPRRVDRTSPAGAAAAPVPATDRTIPRGMGGRL